MTYLNTGIILSHIDSPLYLFLNYQTIYQGQERSEGQGFPVTPKALH